jgi:hypothetical protein
MFDPCSVESTVNVPERERLMIPTCRQETQPRGHPRVEEWRNFRGQRIGDLGKVRALV